MAKDVMVCEVCGKKLPAMSKSLTCSDTCRKRKSRLGLDAGKNMMAARNAIRYVIKGFELDVINTGDIYDDYEALVELLGKLRDAHIARYDREIAQRRDDE